MTAGGRRSCPGHVGGPCPFLIARRPRSASSRNLVLAGQDLYVTKTVAPFEQYGPQRENESEPWRERQ